MIEIDYYEKKVTESSPPQDDVNPVTCDNELLQEALAGHLLWLLDAHDLKDGWSNVAELTRLYLNTLVLRDINTWNRVQ